MQNKLLSLLLIQIIFILPSGITAEAELPKFGLGLGLGYPAFSVRYRVTDIYTVEIKYIYDQSIFVSGIRGYRLINPIGKTVFYLTGEFDYIGFNTYVGHGNGILLGMFIGGEYYIYRNFSLNLDFGLSVINLTTSINLTRTEPVWVANLGVNFYPELNIPYFTTKKNAFSTEKIRLETDYAPKNKNQVIDEYLRTGDKLYQEGNYSAAIQEWRKVLTIDPKHTVAKRKIEKAQELWQKKTNPTGTRKPVSTPQPISPLNFQEKEWQGTGIGIGPGSGE